MRVVALYVALTLVCCGAQTATSVDAATDAPGSSPDAPGKSATDASSGSPDATSTSSSGGAHEGGSGASDASVADVTIQDAISGDGAAADAQDAGNTCAPSQTDCGGTCVDEHTDPANCGGCGQVCAGTCTAGRCLVTLAAGQNGPDGIAVDASRVYWTNAGDGTVMAVPLDGGTPITLASGQSGLAKLVVDTTSAYWANVRAARTPFSTDAA